MMELIFLWKSGASIKVCRKPIVSLGNREVNIPEIGSGDCDYGRIDVRGTSAEPIIRRPFIHHLY